MRGLQSYMSIRERKICHYNSEEQLKLQSAMEATKLQIATVKHHPPWKLVYENTIKKVNI